MDMKNYILPALILGLAMAGARLQSIPILYLFLGLICLSLILVSLGWYKKYPILVFSIGLGLLYQTTLTSNYIVGTDIHGEYYFAALALDNGFNFNIPEGYNVALGGSLVPYLVSKVFHIPLVWVFKAVLPIFLALVPLVLFYSFKRFLSDEESFFSVIFLMVVPTYFLELTGIGKQMVGELFLVLCLCLIFARLNWKIWVKLSLIFALIPLTFALHYSCGVILSIYLIGLVPILLIGRYREKKSVGYLALAAYLGIF